LVFGTSKVLKASSGFLQGGHLSPILFSLFVNRVTRVLNHCKILCFADDMKLIMQINFPDDCLKLQADLNYFYKWSQLLGLTLNLDKCHIMSFTRKYAVINWSYSLNNSEIFRVEMIVNLGFKFNCSLDQGPHITMICCTAYKMLGFLKR
jgi:hypothetical protein